MHGYADDFVLLHEHLEFVLRSRDFISQWLSKVGLTLHPTKTRIVHTLEVNNGTAGFDFLGHHIRQFRTGKYATKPCLKQVYTGIIPSKGAQTRVYKKIAEIIETTLASPHKRDAPNEKVRILIWRLNPIIKGWSNYFRHCNSKETFSRLDHLIWYKLWKALRRHFRSKGRKWIVETYLKSPKGTWHLACLDPQGDREIRKRLFAETPIKRHFPVQKGRSFFDGDWAYWAGRTGEYPGLPAKIGRRLKLQHGRRQHCREPFNKEARLYLAPVFVGPPDKLKATLVLVHQQCAADFRRSSDRGQNPVADAVSSPVR